MNAKRIYRVLQPVMIQGATIQDIYHDIQATSWAYAYEMTKHLPRLITFDDIKAHGVERDYIFNEHYTKALKILRVLKHV
jgi:hypothetical protein